MIALSMDTLSALARSPEREAVEPIAIVSAPTLHAGLIENRRIV